MRPIPPATQHPLMDSWFKRAYAEDRQPYGPPRYLHHYVKSYDSLMSILASRTVWASDVHCLKDSTEFEHGIPVCLEALSAIDAPILSEHVQIIGQGLSEQFLYKGLRGIEWVI